MLKYVCDRCGVEIKGNVYEITFETEGPTTHLCNGCCDLVRKVAQGAAIDYLSD